MGTSCWIYGTRQPQLAPFPLDGYNHRIIKSSQYKSWKRPSGSPLWESKLYAGGWIVLPAFHLQGHRMVFLGGFWSATFLPWPCPPLCPPIPVGEGFPERNITTRSQPTDQLLRENPFSPAWGKDKKQCSPPSLQNPPASPTQRCCISPLISTNSPHRKVPEWGFELPSSQLIKNTFQNQLYLHFNNICNYNYSSSSEKLLHCMQITNVRTRNFRKWGTPGLQTVGAFVERCKISPATLRCSALLNSLSK